ncbi:MAG: hypothetical protein A2Z20_04485 [Bdellovibrionales bacterium RBG_16_40_8]|nr:MAG: hypothetical protein A2Z20_04485 [Bdellovibrionales bacterium RBG_16_40_8]
MKINCTISLIVSGLWLFVINVDLVNAKDESFNSNYSSGDIVLEKMTPPEDAKKCVLCHTKKSRQYIYESKKLERNHIEINVVHGKKSFSCNSCHDINNHNLLISTKLFTANFENPSPVCNECHSDKYREWLKGMHGKRNGGWARDKIQFQCTHCHKSHQVKFPEFDTVAPPPVIKDWRNIHEGSESNH